ncbi:MAG TPA: ComEC/Rec2 family competence protein, partial [Niabella sp.]|nr:ComEC/Rec2 family competence protein [Niabella sp.]
TLDVSVTIFVSALFFALLFQWLRGYRKFKYQPVQGILIGVLLLSLGMMLTWFKDVRHDPQSLYQTYHQNQALVAVVQEPLSEKERSYKAEARVTHLIQKDSVSLVTGNILIYFKKDSFHTKLAPGSKILFSKPLQEIKNTGNPGAFDYKRYCLFNGIEYQVYLTGDDWTLISEQEISFFKRALINARTFVLQAIRNNISGKKEQGLAEAMLIGYRDDLDKTLLQSYTNTGVVHVIAVSGMHLALLYWILNLILQPLLKSKSTKWLHPVLVLFLLWSFAFITGGAASIVRAAVMFSLITIGKELNRNASIYNVLAGAAFVQLCYNPYWLWDVGFQLSYFAVLSILIFYKPIYQLFYLKSKWLNYVWQLASVSMAAQILTTPLSVYYFHQFPIYFLITNLVVVPASTIILIATLLVVIFSPLTTIASILGYGLDLCIKWLNRFIEWMEQLPLAVWGGLQINTLQSILLLLTIIGFAALLMAKYKHGIWIGLFSLLAFFIIRAYSFYVADNQHKIIVYNVPKLNVMDFMNGRQFQSIADTTVLDNLSLHNYVLNPSRIVQRVQAVSTDKSALLGHALFFGDKRILIIDSSVSENKKAEKLVADIVVLTGNPKLYMSRLLSHVIPGRIVVSAAVPAWRTKFWEKDCDSLNIPLHNVATSGAFVWSR